MNLRLFTAIFALLATAGISRAQWFQTTYSLKKGWNAIYLHGDATWALTPDVLFPGTAGTPTANITEVWRWNPRPNQMQFTKSPLIPSATAPEWSVWRRGGPSTLSDMTGQTAYLVKTTDTAPATFNVPLTLRAMPPSALWVRSGANLLGFPSKEISTAVFPSFSSYFAPFPAATAANAKIFKYVGGDLTATNPLQIFSPTLEQVDRNKAYWFEAEVVGNYYAPLDISLSQSTGLDFGRTGSVITARLRNTTGTPMSVTITRVASIAAPAGQPAVTGTLVPLTRRTFNAGTASWTETPITAAYTELIGPNSTLELNFGINRAGMTGGASAFYASLLRLTDSGNLFDINLPVSARVASMAGLWVGDATVTNIHTKVQSTATAKALLTDGKVTGIEVTGGGFGYPSVLVPPPAIAPAVGTTATATATRTGSGINALTVNIRGSGYLIPPAVTIGPPNIAGSINALASAIINKDGVVTGFTMNHFGTGYTTVPAVTIAPPAGVQATATAAIAAGGGVTTLTVGTRGSGYLLPPAVTIAPSPSGATATAVANISNGFVVSITRTSAGSGYTEAPLVTIGAPSTVMQAVATATVSSGGTVASILVSNTGLGYFSPPAVTVELPASGVRATAVAIVSNGRVTGITVQNPGSGYTASDPPVITIAGPTPKTAATITAIVRNGNVTGFDFTPGSGYLLPPTITLPNPPPPGTTTARRPPLRVLLHVDDDGNARLLSQVFVGTLTDGTEGLCTKETRLRAAEKAQAKRLVAAHLPLDRDPAGDADVTAAGGEVQFTVSIPYDDATNPFVHRYHPDHDNKSPRGDLESAGYESYTITRELTFDFKTTPPAGESPIGWGSSVIGGNYKEVIKGLHKEDLTIQGTFVLRRASENGTLTRN